jgi:phosphate/sulfate permease
MKFQGWMGLIVGPVAGALAYVKYGRKGGQSFDPAMLVAFVGIGLLAGAVLWWVDARRSKRS